MSWTKRDEDIRLCKEWLINPFINPETNKKIERNGPTFNIWKKKCKNYGLKKGKSEITWAKCQEFKINPLVNPETGRPIKKDGTIYKQYMKACKTIKKPGILGVYPSPDSNGLVPCFKCKNNYYIARTYQGRKVYGELNKAVFKITMIYFKDTWDYTHKKYKPIFRGKEPSKSWLSISITEDPKKKVDHFINLFL